MSVSPTMTRVMTWASPSRNSVTVKAGILTSRKSSRCAANTCRVRSMFKRICLMRCSTGTLSAASVRLPIKPSCSSPWRAWKRSTADRSVSSYVSKGCGGATRSPLIASRRATEAMRGSTLPGSMVGPGGVTGQPPVSAICSKRASAACRRSCSGTSAVAVPDSAADSTATSHAVLRSVSPFLEFRRGSTIS